MKVNFSITDPYTTTRKVKTKIIKPEEGKNAPFTGLGEDVKDTFISGDSTQMESEKDAKDEQ